ncbi:MAG: phosphodiester glycosidase family protein [Oscillibacter sp.]|nr:phosphodiester glycosidase family protein [Oscillibacter sp.]
MENLWSGKRFGVLFSVLLTAFTAYALLDTFVIPRQYAVVAPDSEAVQLNEVTAPPQDTERNAPTSQNADNSDAQETQSQSADGSEAIPDMSRKPRRTHSGAGGSRTKSRESADGSATNNGNAENSVTVTESGVRSYSDDNISINITQYRAYNTDIYVADVTLSSPEYLKTALAGNAYGRNIKEKTSTIAAENNAILAINGDYYGARNSGYVIRNGTLYRDSAAGGEVLAIFADGSFRIADDREVTAQALLDAGAVQVLSFGPALVKDGAVTVTEGQEVGKAMASNPRTAIGVMDNLHYVFVVADGRTGQSAGMSLYELAEFMRGLGVKTAYNLDGGGSSTMTFNGEIINHPTTNGNSVKERSVSDIVYLGA